MSQPEVRFVAPSGGASCSAPSSGGSTGVAPACATSAPKYCSFLNFSRSRTKVMGGGFGGVGAGQPITTVVPAFATATIPIALQTTQFVSGSEFGLIGARRESALTQGEIADLVRDAVRRESARQESARSESARPESGPSCAELKTRVDRIEQRLEQIEKKVDGIAKKLEKLP